MRTLDNSNIRESVDTSIASHATSKKKLISLLLERSRMSPTHEEESLMKLMSIDEKDASSNEPSVISNRQSSPEALSRKASKEKTSAPVNPSSKNVPQQQNLKKITMGVSSLPSKENNLSPEKNQSKITQNPVKQSYISSKNTPIVKQGQSGKTTLKQTPTSVMIGDTTKPTDAKIKEISQLQKQKEIGKSTLGQGIQKKSVLKEQADKNEKNRIQKIEKEADNTKKATHLGEESKIAEANKDKEREADANLNNEGTLVRPFSITETESVIVPDAQSSLLQRELELEEAVKALNIKIFLVSWPLNNKILMTLIRIDSSKHPETPSIHSTGYTRGSLSFVRFEQYHSKRNYPQRSN